MPTCPVCGYPSLEEPPRSPSGGGSYEICPSCGFQFGVDDDDKGITHEEWRARWKEKGYAWSSRGIAAPAGWKAEPQLASMIGGATPPPSRAKKAAATQSKKKAKTKPAPRKPLPKPKKKSPPAKSKKKATRKKK